MFSKFFIERPIFATVLALLFVVAGLVTLNILPVAQYPDITPPTVQVSAVYPGANAETVAQTVGIPIEQQVNGVDGMLLYEFQFLCIGRLFADSDFRSGNGYRYGNCDGTKPCQCSIEFFTRSCEGTGSDGAEAVIQYCDDAYTEW